MRSAVLRLSLGLVVAVVLLDGFWLLLLWPNWKNIAAGEVPRSRFMKDWERQSGQPVRWTPVPLSEIPQVALRAIVVAEDGAFWEHGGFDLEALKEAARRDARRHRIILGGSTIDQQTAKNLFLTPARSPLRKWHEAVLTWGLERHCSKRRILEIYLNDAELGPGLYGLEAASLAYFGRHASDLRQAEAIELAATLPSPRADNPVSRTPAFQKRVEKVRRLLSELGELTVELPPAEVAGSAGIEAPVESQPTPSSTLPPDRALD